MTTDELKAKVAEFKTNHPRFATVVDGISDLDLKETVKVSMGAEVLQKLLKVHTLNLVKDALEAEK